MAKWEQSLSGDFHHFCSYLKRQIIEGSMSASLEDESYRTINDIHIGVLVFERYSVMGSNRVSLNVTVIGADGRLDVIAITSGGSQAILFKVNTWGEESFLELFQNYVEEYR